MGKQVATDLRASILLAAVICLALSTQFLFERPLYEKWEADEIVSAWLMRLADLAAVAFAMIVSGFAAAAIPVRNRIVRAGLFTCALGLGAFLGEWGVLYAQWAAPPSSLEGVLVLSLRWVPLGIVCGALVSYRSRAREQEARLHQVEVDRIQLEREAAASEASVLQAQVEPHFLFNTLATIRRLQQVDPPKGRETLSGFLRYLQLALPAMRSRFVPLSAELGLVAAYLDVLRVRMGKRLNVAIDVPAALGAVSVPPLSIATLVENSVKHGLARLPEGGTIAIEARMDEAHLVLTVADTGVGFVNSDGTGSGLANLRMRLRGLYEGDATLALAPNNPRGFRATVRLPCPILEAAAHG